MPPRRGNEPTGARVALVTGAAQGLGHATARRLAADGFTVAVNDVADDGRLSGLADRMAASPCRPISPARPLPPR